MEGSRSLDPADCSRFHAYPRLTPTPAAKPPESFWCAFLCDRTVLDYPGRQPLNDKPSVKEGLTRQGGCLTLLMRIERDGSLMDCSSSVNHPTTPCSGMLVGETTRSITLNSDRGGGSLNAQRVVGKREPHTGNREK